MGSHASSRDPGSTPALPLLLLLALALAVPHLAVCPSSCQEAPPARHAGGSKVKVGDHLGLHKMKHNTAQVAWLPCNRVGMDKDPAEGGGVLPASPHLLVLDIIAEHLLLVDAVELVLIVCC